VKEQVGPRCFIESDPNIMKRVSSEEYVNVMANIIFFKKGGKSFAEIILDKKKGNKNRNIYREHPVPSEPKKKNY
jgi:hypothetical protein